MTTLIPKFDLKDGGVTPTGAVNRPINEKLSESISVTDFGATGNGTTDDTTAIQNAINSASNGASVYFPPGTYKTTAPLTVETNTTLVGSNRNVCIIRNNVTTILTTKEPLATRYYDISISELTFDGVTINSQIGLSLPHVSFSKLNRVAISNCATGIYYIAQKADTTVTGAYYNAIYDPLVTGCTNGVVFDKTANQNYVHGGKINSCDSGAYLGDVNGVNFISTSFEANITYGVAITGYDCSLVSCRFEGNNTCIGINNNPTNTTYSNYVYAPHFQTLLQNYNDVTDTLTIIADSGMNLGIRTHVTAFSSKRTAAGSLPMMYLQDTTTTAGTPVVYQSQQGRFAGYHLKGLNESNTQVYNVNYYGEYECLTSGRGIYLHSPNGSRWAVTVSNAGALVVTAA